MGDSRNTLLDDRPLIKDLRYIVSRRANYLHTGVVGLLVRFPSYESRQK